jgi:hypothetical protein
MDIMKPELFQVKRGLYFSLVPRPFKRRRRNGRGDNSFGATEGRGLA